jgi:type IV secretion system protein TrbL
MGSAAATSYRIGQTAAGSTSVGAGLSGMARAAAGAAWRASGIGDAAKAGHDAAVRATGGMAQTSTPSTSGSSSASVGGAYGHTVLHTLRDSDRGGSGPIPDLKQKDD